jgi:hypothetical protein
MPVSATLQDCLRQKSSRYEVVYHPYPASIRTSVVRQLPVASTQAHFSYDDWIFVTR